MSRRKQKEKQRQQKRKQKRKQRQAVRRAQPRSQPDLGPIDLRVRHPELAQPPVYVNSSGHRIPDPFACLGLDPRQPATPETIQSAFRSALAATPPETDPQRARDLVEARDFLLEPEQILARTMGDLRVPNPEHFLPGYERRTAPSAASKPAAVTGWSSRSRLVALMTLYALLEEELEPGADPKGQAELRFE